MPLNICRDTNFNKRFCSFSFQRIDLHRLNLEDIREMLKDIGFYRKSDFTADIPAEYNNGVFPPPNGVTFDMLISGKSQWSEHGRIVVG